MMVVKDFKGLPGSNGSKGQKGLPMSGAPGFTGPKGGSL